MKVEADDNLRTVAFKVCTVLQKTGLTVVLTGGSAATVYAPEAYQSEDLDFVVQISNRGTSDAKKAIAGLGYFQQDEQYIHRENPLTLDFLEYPISIGRDTIDTWTTLNEGGMVLNILSSTDCCRDRLAHFLYWNDRAALSQAIAVARKTRVDLDTIQEWCEREGQEGKFKEFRRVLQTSGGC